jgi:hypothetical protein
MSDILVLWNKPLLWNRLFQEYGMSSSSALPDALFSPHLPPAKLILIPTGFMSLYSADAASFTKEKTAGKLTSFVENGGTLLIFSPKINEPASFSWLNLPVAFVPENISLRKKTSLLDGESFSCDGWFQNLDENCAVIESDDMNRPIHLSVQKGKGKIILSSVHEFLSKSYFLSLLNGHKVKI